MTADVCIIGGGIAGLYLATKLLDRGMSNVVVLEADRTFSGGRVEMTRFAGRDVVLGAGVGRASKDVALGRLLASFGPREKSLLYAPFEVEIDRAPTVRQQTVSRKRLDRLVRESAAYARRPHAPFGDVLREALGPSSKEEYDRILDASLYTNFEADDATDVIEDYGMDDNEGGWTAWRVDWKRLVGLLKDRIGANGGRGRLVAGCRAVRLEKGGADGSSWIVRAAGGRSFACRVVVIATDVRTVRALLPKSPLYRNNAIRGQPFVRVYATFEDPESKKIMADAVRHLTIVPRPLKKIIPIDPAKSGMYMIAYSDNADALAVRRVMHKKAAMARMVEKALGIPEKSLRIARLRSRFWPVGTHAYLPLSTKKFASRTEFIRRAQRPMPGVFVVGEMVSRQQGWVEGALRSVDAVTRECRGGRE